MRRNIKVKSVKPVEVVTFPGTGFFSKPLMGLVITCGNVMVDRVEHEEGGKAKLLHIRPQVLPPSLLVSGARQI